ncbi:MAG TPA: hypothetical protein VJJ82_03770 [Candidatus Nanoarchaeia archaeon]|nr:hypothetical protein [Candidatus Nanoarchaeia archaeon]
MFPFHKNPSKASYPALKDVACSDAFTHRRIFGTRKSRKYPFIRWLKPSGFLDFRCNTKGTWVLADALYWFFYIPLTALIVIALVTIPTSILRATVQPVELDASIMGERLAQKITAYSPVLGAQSGRLGDITAANLALSEKRHAYRITVGDKSAEQSVVGNQDFYDEAIPLTPIKHKRFTFTTTMIQKKSTEERIVPVTIDQVYPERYG